MTYQILAPQLDRDEVFKAILNAKGVPRLSRAKGYFQNLQQSDIPLLVEAYTYWKEFNEYMLLFGKKQFSRKKEQKFVLVKCSKRGNDVFASRLQRKLGFLEKYSDQRFFDASDFKVDKKVFSSLLWVTLTYNSQKSSLSRAWKTCMKEFNLWITNLRNKYGRIQVLRFIQAFPDERGRAFGYPHFHVALYFEDAQFEVFPRMEENREGELGLVFRIQEKDQVHDQGKWHSFTDVKALSSMGAVLNYCRKHSQNVAFGRSYEAELNCALSWLFKKHTYSLSGGFREALRVHYSMQISKQKTLDGGAIPIWKWEFIGIFPQDDLPVSPEDGWSIVIADEVGHKLAESMFEFRE